MTRLVLAAAVLAVLASSVAAGTAATRSPGKVRSGDAIFADKCIYCHDARGWGTRALAARVPEGEAMLTRRSTLPADYVRVVVRRGLGSMPGFTPTDLSDAEVASVATWLEKPAGDRPETGQ